MWHVGSTNYLGKQSKTGQTADDAVGFRGTGTFAIGLVGGGCGVVMK